MGGVAGPEPNEFSRQWNDLEILEYAQQINRYPDVILMHGCLLGVESDIGGARVVWRNLKLNLKKQQRVEQTCLQQF